jgi:hypothetical protein
MRVTTKQMTFAWIQIVCKFDNPFLKGKAVLLFFNHVTLMPVILQTATPQFSPWPEAFSWLVPL